MPQGDVILDEQSRSKLDGIVSQMQANNESDEDIQFVVNDFKSKYGTSPKPPTSSQGAENGVPKFLAPTKSTESPFTFPSYDGSSGSKSQTQKPKLKAEQIRTLKTMAFNKEQAIKNANENVAPIKEETSLPNDLYHSFKAGSEKLGSMLAKTPSFIYDVAAVPQNLVAKYTGLNVGASSQEFAKQLGISENEVAKYYDDAYKQTKINIDAKYDKPITEYFANGEYSKGLKSLANQVLESTPVSIALMSGNAAGLSPMASTIGGAFVFGADKKSELDANAPQMDEPTKTLSAFGNGVAEGIFEQFGITKLGSAVKDIVEKEGLEAAEKFAEKSFKEVYAPVLKKYIGIGIEEPLGEAATQFVQNVVTKYSGENPDLDLSEGVADAAIVGLGSSFAFGAPTIGADLFKNKKLRDKAQELQIKKDAINNDIANPNIPNEAKDILSEQAKNINEELANLHNEDKVSHSTLDDDKKAELSKNASQIDILNTSIDNPDLSEQAKEVFKSKVDELESKNEKILSEAPKFELSTENKSEPIELNVDTNIQPQVGQGENVGGVGNEAEATPSVEAEVKSEIPQQDTKEIEKNIQISGLREGFEPSTYHSFDVRSDVNIMNDINNRKPFITTTTRNGKEHIVVGVNIKSIKGSISGRDGFSFATIEKTDNLPNNINDILIEKAKENAFKLYPDIKEQDIEIPQQKIDETTKSEEAVVPSEEGASGEDTNVGKAEEEKGVGEGTKEVSQENIDKINYTLRDKENNVLVRLPLSNIETGVPKGNVFAEQRKGAAQAHLEGAIKGHDKENTATQASLDKDGNLFIADGRHRIEAQKDSGVKYGWFEVPKEQAKQIESKYETTPNEEVVAPTTEKAEGKNAESKVEPIVASEESPVNLEKNGTNSQVNESKNLTETPILNEAPKTENKIENVIEVSKQQQEKISELEPKEQALYWAKKYNGLSKAKRKLEGGNSFKAELQKLSKAHGIKVTLTKGGTLVVKDKDGVIIKRKPIIRSKDEIQNEKQEKEFKKRALNAIPVSVEHGVALFLAQGGRFDRKQVSQHIKSKDGVGWITSEKGGMKPEFFGEWLSDNGFTQGLDEYGQPMGGGMDLINDVIDALDFYTDATRIKDVEKKATEFAVEMHYKVEYNGFTKSEVEALNEEYKTQKEEEKFIETMGWLDELSDEEAIEFDKLEESKKEEFINQLIKEHENEEQDNIGEESGVIKSDNEASVKEANRKEKITEAKKDYESKQRAYEKAKAKLEANGMQDQTNMFGGTKAEEMLFKNDLKEQRDLVDNLRKEAEKAKSVFDKLSNEPEIDERQLSIESAPPVVENTTTDTTTPVSKESVSTEPTAAQKEYEEAISKKSKKSQDLAKEKFINRNFETIVAQLMLNNTIKRKC